MGLSSSALNSRYFSQQNLKVQVRATDSDSESEPTRNEKPRRKKSSASRNGQRPEYKARRGRSDSDGGANLSDDMDDVYPQRPATSATNGKADEYYHNGRNGRFIKAAVPSGANKKVVKGGVSSSRAYIETRHSEPRDLSTGDRKSSAMSDTSETVSLSMLLFFFSPPPPLVHTWPVIYDIV